ncbi:hypothetical protein TNCV_708761 [Trichonephila clavipes]|nr:hypothetical protein TNCV_708761 [Trichonephila clavipes]
MRLMIIWSKKEPQSSKHHIPVSPTPPSVQLLRELTFFRFLICIFSLLGFGWKRVAINSDLKEPTGHVKEKTREPVTSCLVACHLK